MSDPKRHHYVPKCYLNKFANPQRQLWKKYKKNNMIFTCTPKQICYETNAFQIRHSDTLIINDLQDNYYIEKNSFKKQENSYGNIISEIIKYSSNNIVIDKQDYKLFLETLITIKRRNPFTRDNIKRNFLENVRSGEALLKFKSFMIQMNNRFGDNLDVDAYLKDYMTNKLGDEDKLQDNYLNSFINLEYEGVIINISQDLYKYRPYVLHAPIGCQFITSDNPGFTKTKNYILSIGGFGEPFNFYFPLSPSTCLFINSNNIESNNSLEKFIYPVLIDKRTVIEVNTYTKQTCNEIIIGFSKEVLNLV